MRITVFGAGGRAGRALVAEAVARDVEVTAVVRDPAAHRGLTARVVAGDVTDAASVARAAEGADVVVQAAADLAADPHVFFAGAAEALVQSAPQARAIALGIATVVPGRDGAVLADDPEFVPEGRAFSLGHRAGLDVLRGSEVDWLYAAPGGDFDHEGTRTGRYRVAAHTDMTDRISYPDFAVALLDEIQNPTRHRAVISFGGA